MRSFAANSHEYPPTTAGASLNPPSKAVNTYEILTGVRFSGAIPPSGEDRLHFRRIQLGKYQGV